MNYLVPNGLVAWFQRQLSSLLLLGIYILCHSKEGYYLKKPVKSFPWIFRKIKVSLYDN